MLEGGVDPSSNRPQVPCCGMERLGCELHGLKYMVIPCVCDKHICINLTSLPEPLERIKLGRSLHRNGTFVLQRYEGNMGFEFLSCHLEELAAAADSLVAVTFKHLKVCSMELTW